MKIVLWLQKLYMLNVNIQKTQRGTERKVKKQNKHDSVPRWRHICSPRSLSCLLRICLLVRWFSLWYPWVYFCSHMCTPSLPSNTKICVLPLKNWVIQFVFLTLTLIDMFSMVNNVLVPLYGCIYSNNSLAGI